MTHYGDVEETTSSGCFGVVKKAKLNDVHSALHNGKRCVVIINFR